MPPLTVRDCTPALRVGFDDESPQMHGGGKVVFAIYGNAADDVASGDCRPGPVARVLQPGGKVSETGRNPALKKQPEAGMARIEPGEHFDHRP